MKELKFGLDPDYQINPEHPLAPYAEKLKQARVPLVDIERQVAKQNPDLSISIVKPESISLQILPSTGTTFQPQA